ncbi:hypothetical protein DL764_007606 [Monosporascus ibericus]|uniref:Xylanolytic transcriptional activator regulatory domain-containing protein n=1 Tax=Monosporascus ibericus TaxID=155417 RepID=A0A4Q4SZP5_9PEZI|nr:hypothetical protein DL764_007606 [Monosporascus ibericus]
MEVEAGPADSPTSAGQKQHSKSSPQQSPANGSNGPPAATTATQNAQGQMSFRRHAMPERYESFIGPQCSYYRMSASAHAVARSVIELPGQECRAINESRNRIPQPKRKKTQANANKDSDSDRGDQVDNGSPQPSAIGGSTNTFQARPVIYHSAEGTPSTDMTEAQTRKEEVDNRTYVDLVMKPKFTRAPITDAGRVAFLGESSNFNMLVHDRQGSSDIVHYPLPENVRGTRARLTELDNIEIDILHQRGAFLLPPRSLCDELIEAYFTWVHPIVPVINRTRFVRQYKDPKNPPSLLLLQSVLLAGSRVCSNKQLMDANGSTTPAALTFYKRAKALYDANYEDDRVTIVQSLVLLSWFWEGPEDVTKNVFYWTRVAVTVAQGIGMHRSVEKSQLSKADKRLWKRVWWTIFTRDRSCAVALGRPCGINLEDSDVDMITEDDFIEDEPGHTSPYCPDPVHVDFFLQYVKLCEIMGLVLSQQYSAASRARPKNAIDLTHSDMALADWLQNCPRTVYWEMPRHHFWSALLHLNYYTTLTLLHRAHMPPSTSHAARFPDDISYPSRNIAFQAAGMVTSIVENLSAHDQLKFSPAFIIYSIFSALIMHVYQMRSPVPSIQQVTQDRIRTCMDALKEVSKVWLVGKMVHTLFEAIIGNRVLEEKLQKAAGKHHKKAHQALAQLDQHQHRQQDTTKRKYDEIALDFSVNAPVHQESYERSRPQTPRNEAAQGHPQMGPPINSPHTIGRNGDAFMGGASSRPHTRPATPFNPSFSVPTTPPDLYLVTRNSPNLSQSLWENFQPDLLFPESSMSQMPSPAQNHQNLDPDLMAQMQAGMSSPSHQQHQHEHQQQHHQSPQHQGASGLQDHSHPYPSFFPQLQQQQQQQQRRVSPRHAALLSHPSPHTNSISHPGLGGFGTDHNNSNNNSADGSHQATMTTGLGGNNHNIGQHNSNLWQQQDFNAPPLPDGQSPSDSWSTASAQGQAVPTNFNVGDWYHFFGLDGEDIQFGDLDTFPTA